ncbi:nuclear transport factor 2 family protein [Streptomyces sp. NPDC002088]|uniref:ester cyclase n=1 Tax=Streptomyces sp. NPDC002088 TaxID=3154665 RepID=UPI003330FB86
MTDEATTLGRRMYEAFNARDLTALEAIFAVDFVSHPLGTTGVAAVSRAWSGLFAAYPEVRVTVEDMLVDRDKVAVRSVLCGIPGGAPGTAPTMMEIFRVHRGRIAELWGLSSFARQGR